MRRGCFTAAQVLHRQTDNPWMVCWAACVIFTDLIHSKSNDTTVKLLNCEVNQFIVLGFMCTRTFTTIQTRLFSTMQMVPEGLSDRLLTILYPESDFVCGQTEVIPRNCLLEVQFGLKKQIRRITQCSLCCSGEKGKKVNQLISPGVTEPKIRPEETPLDSASHFQQHGCRSSSGFFFVSTEGYRHHKLQPTKK